MKNDLYLSVVIPVYNEENRIEAALTDVFGYLSGIPEKWEVIIADDGSRDRTAEIVKTWQQKHPELKYIAAPRNQGKGAAVQRGMSRASARWRLFRDADSSTAMKEFDHFRPHLDRGAPIVIGSRRVAGATFVNHQPWLRETLGRGFTLLCRCLLVWEIRDYTCGFKCFSAEAAEKIFPRQRIFRWGFDSEILFVAKTLGYPIIQEPVTWSHDTGTKVHLFKDVLASFWEIICIRTNSLRGLYR